MRRGTHAVGRAHTTHPPTGRDKLGTVMQAAGCGSVLVGAAAVMIPARHYVLWPTAAIGVYLFACVAWVFFAGVAWIVGVMRCDYHRHHQAAYAEARTTLGH
jgi:hypothetical protein